MRSVMEFIKEDEILEGSFTLNKQKYSLGLQEDNTVLFKRPNDDNIYKGFMFCQGYAVSLFMEAKPNTKK